jgi:hypothetical protein
MRPNAVLIADLAPFLLMAPPFARGSEGDVSQTSGVAFSCAGVTGVPTAATG